MIQLPNGCYCSEPSIYPRNWNKASASIKDKWYAQYYLHDPAFKNDPKYKYGKLIILKMGINRLKTIKERRIALLGFIDKEIELLKSGTYNPITAPITKSKPQVLEANGEISPNTSFMEALYYALPKLDCKPKYKDDIKSTLKYFGKAAAELKFNNIPIKDITKKHIILILDHCPKVKPYWSANQFNRYKDHISGLYNPLLDIEIAEYNPTEKIKDKAHVQKIREVLSKEEREKVDIHLKKNNYNFWRFVNIFFHSGGRLTELLSIKKEDIDLVNQRYKCVIEKGKQHKEVWRTIKDVALPLWQELINQSNSNQYLFGKNLQPRDKRIRVEQVTKKWKRHVKHKLGIKADLYSLKHLNTDETAAMLGIQDAAAMNSHTTTAITLKHYAIGEKERQHQRLKQVQNPFA